MPPPPAPPPMCHVPIPATGAEGAPPRTAVVRNKKKSPRRQPAMGVAWAGWFFGAGRQPARPNRPIGLGAEAPGQGEQARGDIGPFQWPSPGPPHRWPGVGGGRLHPPGHDPGRSSGAVGAGGPPHDQWAKLGEAVWAIFRGIRRGAFRHILKRGGGGPGGRGTPGAVWDRGEAVFI